MMPERKIRYLDYCREDVKVCGAGFVKLEEYSDYVTITINVKCRSLTGTILGLVTLEGPGDVEPAGWSCPLGDMEIIEGEGLFARTIGCSNTEDDTYDRYGKSVRLGIAWGGESALRCELQQPFTAQKQRKQNRVEKASTAEAVTAMTATAKPSSEQARQVTVGDSGTVKNQVADNKWEQLLAIYPHINPFQDEREYLEVGPGDFLVLDENSYQNANNSFLLHGFYNYKHLVLARVERNHEKVYYLGAPGNYYEREKQVALLFGFESFECAEEPAQMGDFGYYMMRVQI